MLRLLTTVLLGALLWLASPTVVRAATSADAATKKTNTITVIPELTLIPGLFEAGKAFTISPTSIADYIRIIFVVFIWIVGILATVMVVYGGVRWIAAAGNPGQINEARSIVDNAIIGLIIALTSVLLLNVISPTLTTFRGLTLPEVQKEVYDFTQSIAEEVGDIPACRRNNVAGEPTKACSGRTATNPGSGLTYDCIDLNSSINGNVNYVDRVAIKALIMVESPKVNGQPYSGPEGNTGPGNTPGPGYGLGQFKASTMFEVIDKLNPKLKNTRIPPVCQPGQAIGSDGIHLTQACKDLLDSREKLLDGLSGLDVQALLVAAYFWQQMNDKVCVNQNLALAAAAYNQGLGGASDSFCNTDFLHKQTPTQKDVIKAKAINYIAKFRTAYSQACAAAG